MFHQFNSGIGETKWQLVVFLCFVFLGGWVAWGPFGLHSSTDTKWCCWGFGMGLNSRVLSAVTALSTRLAGPCAVSVSDLWPQICCCSSSVCVSVSPPLQKGAVFNWFMWFPKIQEFAAFLFYTCALNIFNNYTQFGKFEMVVKDILWYFQNEFMIKSKAAAINYCFLLLSSMLNWISLGCGRTKQDM